MTLTDQIPEATPTPPPKVEAPAVLDAQTVLQGQQRQVDRNLAEVETRVNVATAERQQGVDTASDSDTDAASTTSTQETGGAGDEGRPEGFLASLSHFFRDVSGSIGDAFKNVGAWLRDALGLKKKEESGVDPDEDRDTDSDSDRDTDLNTTAKPDEIMKELMVKSWEEVKAISDLPTRVFQAALYAYSTNMDCFTSDGNHCSAWCDSVYEKCGLDVYNDKARIYVSNDAEYGKQWGARGTLNGLKLQAGDSIIRYNGNASTGNHQEIILQSTGPDAQGNYDVLTVGQTSVRGDSGVRKIRRLTVKGSDIRVVVRPGATQPWNNGGNLVG
jgi:cell wall-associated NlpC family hydrolase